MVPTNSAAARSMIPADPETSGNQVLIKGFSGLTNILMSVQLYVRMHRQMQMQMHVIVI